MAFVRFIIIGLAWFSVGFGLLGALGFQVLSGLIKNPPKKLVLKQLSRISLCLFTFGLTFLAGNFFYSLTI